MKVTWLLSLLSAVSGQGLIISHAHPVETSLHSTHLNSKKRGLNLLTFHHFAFIL